MPKTRLEAFSDGVMAIIITIMVLELKVPEGATFSALRPLIPVFGSYVLSFILVANFWNNHHHMFLATERVSGAVLWANMGFLFCLSLLPFATAWMGETHLAPAPTALYCGVLVILSVAYFSLQGAILIAQGPGSLLGSALGSDVKGKSTLAILVVAFGCAFWVPLLSFAIVVLVAVIWLIPDSRIERALAAAERGATQERSI